MESFIVAGIVIVIIGASIAYIIKEKKRGAKCIGCPAAGKCSGLSNGNFGCGCGCSSDTDMQ